MPIVAPPTRSPRTLLPFPVSLLLATFAVGCSSGAYRSLLDENDVPDLAALKQSAADLPQRTDRVTVAFRDSGKPVEVAVRRVGGGSRARTILLLHGVFSDGGLWRFVAGDLGRDFDLLIPDLPGCGGSSHPDPGDLGLAGYGPTALARDVLTALRHETRGAPPGTHLTLVGHSLGGIILLRMFGDPALRREFADVMSRVDTVVLIDSADVTEKVSSPVFRSLAELPGWKVGLANLLGVLRGRAAEGTRDGVADPDRRALRQEADRTAAILLDAGRRRAMQAMLAQAAPAERAERDAIRKGYTSVTVPTLILWGERDEIFPSSMGRELAAALPRARLVIVPEAEHSLPIERPRRVAALIREFVTGSARGPGEDRPRRSEGGAPATRPPRPGPESAPAVPQR